MAQTNNPNISVSELYWTLVDKADKKFSKIRDLPYYERNRYDTYFFKVFKVYTQLWKYQQENRQKLVESGLKRWEIGEIASRIAQIYYGQYMRTSEFTYLSESYVFYEAVLSREYFKEGLFQDINLANKQLRFLTRFLMVCLVLNRREMLHQLINQLKMLVDDCKRVFQEADFREWKLVIQEILRFMKADTAFINIRPLRYSLVLDPHPDSLPHVAISVTKRNLRLRDAILSSYHHNEVKFSELTLDTFRMLQSLEWEPSGSFYQLSSFETGQSGAPGPSHISQDLIDHTLPPNPKKAVLYHPSVTHYIAVLATICEELPPDGVLFVYLSAAGSIGQAISSSLGAGAGSDTTQNIIRNFQSHTIHSDVTSSAQYDSLNLSSTQSQGDDKSLPIDCLQFGSRGTGGSNCIYPCDLIPFTRRPLFVVIDSDGCEAFKAINGAEKGEPAALLLSPRSSPPVASAAEYRHSNGSLFTIFLTAPLQAFCLLLGVSDFDIDMDMYNKAEKLLSSSLNDWGVILATSDTLDLVWAQVLSDPFLRRLLLRFIFCRAVLALYSPTFNKNDYIPECLPCLPASVLATTAASQTLVLKLASIFGAAHSFIISEDIMLSVNTHSDMELISPQ